MSISNTAPRLKINKFLLIGKRKDYTLPEFKDGLNIIHGSTDTGKSMILRLITYALGKTNMSKIAPEVQDAGIEIALELSINNQIITIKRDIHDKNKPIQVFYSGIENAKNKPDEEYHIFGTKKYKPISEFILKKLGIPDLKVPYAPMNANKGYNSVSIKDVINLCYLSDEEVGNMNFLGRSHPNKHIKFVESLKALLKVEDSRVNELQKVKGDKLKIKSELTKYTTAIKKFFLDTGELSKQEILMEIEDLKSKSEETAKKLESLNFDIKDKNNISNDFNNEILAKKEIISSIGENIAITKIKLKEFYELAIRYKENIDKKKSILEIDDLLKQEIRKCPHCKGFLEEIDLGKERLKLSSDIEELNHRIFDLTGIISENELLLKSRELNLRREIDKLNELEKKSSEDIKVFISPFLEQRDSLLFEKGTQEELRKNFEEKKKKIDTYELALEKIEMFTREIKEIDSKLFQLKKELREKDKAVEEISTDFNDFINFVKQTSANNPHLDKNFIPRINISGKDVSYYQVAGTAKKVVLCVAYYTALLKYSLRNNTFLPRLLIIDSPSMGRGSNPEDPTEEVDINVYNAMFSYWKKISEEFKTQIIIVDHTMPPEQVKEDILITFDGKGEAGYRAGLIDDLPSKRA